MFGQIGATGRKVGGHFDQKCPNFEYFAWTKMRGFGKIWDQTFMGIIRGPGVDCSNNNRMSPINRTRNSLCHAESRNFAVLSLNSGTVTRCV